MKRVASNVEKRLRESIGNDGLGGIVKRKSGSVLGEGFDESDTEGPDIRRRHRRFSRRGSGFGSVIDIGFAEGVAGLSDGKNGVGRKLEKITDGKEIGRLDVRMDEEFCVEINENVDNGIEHVSRFIGSKSALRKDLRKILFGTFHDDIQKIHAFQAAAAPVKEAKKVWMRELRDLLPDCELLAGGGVFG